MSNPQKPLPKLPIFIVIFVIAALFLLNPVCRYVYTKDFVARRDIQLAELLDHDFETAGIQNRDKPVFFIGSLQTVTNASCLDLSAGKYDIFSIFEAADKLNLDTVESSQYIVSHLNQLGYSYTAPTADDWKLCEAEISEHVPLWKAFPWYDSVMETEHCIIVQLTQVTE